MNKNKKFSELHKQLIKTNDSFELINLEEKLDNVARKIQELSDIDTFIKNLNKFLNQLKKLNKKSILVVTHGGIIYHLSATKFINFLFLFNLLLIIDSIILAS
jgi:broad specificity phosphatase PhoE